MSFAIVGFAIAVGWFILTGLQKIELLVVEKDGFRIAKYVPLFPVAMIGGLIIQLLADKWNLGQYIVRRDINKISGFALDLLIVAAIGSLSLKMITDQWETL